MTRSSALALIVINSVLFFINVFFLVIGDFKIISSVAAMFCIIGAYSSLIVYQNLEE